MSKQFHGPIFSLIQNQLFKLLAKERCGFKFTQRKYNSTSLYTFVLKRKGSYTRALGILLVDKYTVDVKLYENCILRLESNFKMKALSLHFSPTPSMLVPLGDQRQNSSLVKYEGSGCYLFKLQIWGCYYYCQSLG